MLRKRTTRTPEEVVAYLASQMPLHNAKAVAEYLQRNLPVVHTLEDDAIDQALSAAPSAEDPEEYALFVGAALGGVPGTSPTPFLPPEHVSHIAMIRFQDLCTETTSATDKQTHFLYRAANPPIDALWLPSEVEDPPGRQLRIIAERRLHFELMSSMEVPARSRPPRY